MKSSCINHPENDPLIIIRRWQIEVCDGDRVAAALLSFFEYWHNIKLEMRVKAQRANDIAQIHGDQRTQDETLYQFHSEDELIEGIMIAKRDSIRKGVKLLEAKNLISIHKNPNRRYAFDKTRHFLFHPENVNALLAERLRLVDDPCRNIDLDSRNIGDASSILQPPSSILQPPSSVNASAIPEITPEITPETSQESLSLTLSLSQNTERERELEKPKSKSKTEEATREKPSDPISNLPEPEREEFLKFGESRANALPTTPVMIKSWIAANFTELYDDFCKSPERRQAKKKAAVEEKNWRSDPRFDTWIHESFNRGPEWVKEDEAERGQRDKFHQWAMYTNAYEGVCYE